MAYRNMPGWLKITSIFSHVKFCFENVTTCKTHANTAALFILGIGWIQSLPLGVKLTKEVTAAAVTVQLLDLSEPLNFAGVKVWCLGNEGVLKYKYDSERSRHRRMVNTAHIAEDEGGHIQHTESCTQANACNNAYAVSRDYEQFLALRNQPIIFGIFAASLHYFMIENYYDMHRYQALWIQRLRMRELAPEPPDQGSHDPAIVMMKPWL